MRRAGGARSIGATRHVLVLAIRLVPVVFIAACGGPAGSAPGGASSDGAAVAHEDTVIALYDFDERVLGPYWGMEARFLVFLPLVTREGDHWGDYRPGLADRWEHSPDYREWTFHVRRDLRWHDGVPVTAADVAFTVRLRNDPAVLGSSAPSDRARVEVLDEHTVRFVYPEPARGLDWWEVYYPKHLLEDLDPAEFWSWDFWIHPVGDGPFRYVRHVPKTMTELAANFDFPGGPPAVDRVILRYAGERTWPTELRAGNAHTASYVDRITALKVARDPRFRTTAWWGSWALSIFWNQRRPLLSDVRVRRALSLAVDRRELARLLDYPEGVPLHGGLCTERVRRSGSCPPAPAVDRAEAARLLEAAGWRDLDGDGTRERAGPNGRASEAHLTLLAASGDVAERIALFLQDQYRRVGVRAEILSPDGRVAQDRYQAGEFDAYIQRFRHPTDQGDSHLSRIVGPKSPLGWRNPRAEELARAEHSAVAPADRERIYADIRRIFRAEEPIALLVPEVQTHVVDRRVCGLHSPERADPVWFMEYLWVDPSGRCDRRPGAATGAG